MSGGKFSLSFSNKKEQKQKETDEMNEESALVGSAVVEREQEGACTRILRFVHRDINGEIPPHLRVVVRLSYYSWWLFSLSMTWNIVCVATAFVVVPKCGGVISVVLSNVLWLVLIPTVFCVHLLLHNGCRDGSSFKLCLHMFLNTVYIGTMIFFFIGPCSVGIAGVLSLIKAFNKHLVVGIFYLVCLLLWSVIGLIQLWVLYHTWKAHKEGGHHHHEDHYQAQKTVGAEVGSQAFQYAYQNPQIIADASSALPQNTNTAAASRTVYQQPDEVGQAIHQHQQTMGAQPYQAQAPGYPEPAYDPRSVFG